MLFGRKRNNDADASAANGDKSARDPNFLHLILLVVDGSQPSAQATDFAIKFARMNNSELLASYIIDTATMDCLTQMRILVQEEREELQRDLEAKGQRYLARVRQLAAANALEVRTHISRGRFHQVILHLAREHKCDAIIIGGWKNEIQRKDSSSVERQLILDLAECPVIVVKHKEMFSRM